MQMIMKKAGLRPIEFGFSSFFTATFRRPALKKIATDRLVDGLVDGLVENQKKILLLVNKNPKISIKEMASEIGISTTAIDKNITALKNKGLLKRIGSDRRGYWKNTESK